MLRRLWKPAVTAGIVAGLMAAALLTATAASEGNFGTRVPAVQAAPAQSGERQKGLDTEELKQRSWFWIGGIRQAESGQLGLQGPCGDWALLPANDEIEAALQGLVGKRAFAVGRFSTDPNIMMRPTIRVEQIATSEDQVPEGTKLFPKCARQDQKGEHEHSEKHEVREHPAPPASLLGLLERMTHESLRDVAKDERFDHFTSAEINVLDASGNPVKARVIGGVATSKTASSLTIDPNGPAADITVAIDGDTKIVRPGEGGLEAIQAGDKLLVIQLNDKTVAVIASKQVTATVWPAAFAPFGLGGHRDKD